MIQIAQFINNDPDEEGGGGVTKEGESYFPLMEVAVTSLLAVGGIATSAAAMVSAAMLKSQYIMAVYIACGVCMVNSFWVTQKQYVLVKYGGLRMMINKMRDELNSLQEGVDILTETVDDLGEEAEGLQDVEQKLDNIARAQGSNTSELISLFNENESLLKNMKLNLREIAVADITEIVLMADRSGDMIIDLKEVTELTLRVQMKLSSHGINLDVNKFKAVVSKDPDISKVLKLVGGIMFDAHAAAGKENNTRNDARQDIDDDEDEEDETTHMFSLQEKFTKGSVGAARGTGTSLSKSTAKVPPRKRREMMRQKQKDAQSHLIV